MIGLLSKILTGRLLHIGSLLGTLNRPILYSRQVTLAGVWKNSWMYHVSSPVTLSFRLISFEPLGRLLVSIPISSNMVAVYTRRRRGEFDSVSEEGLDLSVFCFGTRTFGLFVFFFAGSSIPLRSFPLVTAITCLTIAARPFSSNNGQLGSISPFRKRVASLLRWNTLRLINSTTCLASNAALSAASATSFKSSIVFTFFDRTDILLLLSSRALRASPSICSALSARIFSFSALAFAFLASDSASLTLPKALSRSFFIKASLDSYSLRVSSSIALFSSSKKLTYSLRLTNSLVKRTFSMRKIWSSNCMLSLVSMYAKVLKISEICNYL